VYRDKTYNVIDVAPQSCSIPPHHFAPPMWSNEASDRWFLGDKQVKLVHVCKCTCFTTNTTLVPLYSPERKADLCNMCTKQFCVEHAEGCKGAKIAQGVDKDAGYEGQVWAKCYSTFQPIIGTI